jgi:hypothetical protein
MIRVVSSRVRGARANVERQISRCDDARMLTIGIDPVVHASRVSAETPGMMNPLPSASTDTHALGETIASLAAGLHAATYEMLVLLREFDARTGWGNGFPSCAHWLHWRTGFDLGASREKVRVARALPSLPRISRAMQHGRVSYAKVRALTRVATPENEESLLNVALAGPPPRSSASFAPGDAWIGSANSARTSAGT